MPDFGVIKNEILRRLVINSVTINSQTANVVVFLITKIAALSEEKQQAVIQLLLNEQSQVEEARSRQFSDATLTELEGENQKIVQIMKNYKSASLAHNEEVGRLVDQNTAEDLLNKLNQL